MVRFHRHNSLCTAFGVGMFALFACAAAGAVPSDRLTQETQQQLASLPPEERAMVERFTPELQQKFLALSPELRTTLKKMQGRHTRHSKQLTLRQVMQEILSEYQGIAAGIVTDNAEQAADSARRLADHRIPVGGLLPYFPLDKINDQSLSILPAMNNAVEGAALRLAEAADQGNMPEAAMHLGEILGSGGKLLTLVSLEEVYMEFFLSATQAPRVRIGGEARIVPDIMTNTSVPAVVSFVSPQAQFTPKQVETVTERESLMFRIRVRIPADQGHWLTPLRRAARGQTVGG